MRRVVLWMVVAGTALVPARETAAGQPWEDLLHQAVGPVHNAEEQKARVEAQDALREAGPEALRFLLGKAHLRNVAVHVLIGDIVRAGRPDGISPVLLDFLASEHPRTRQVAAYYLGYFRTPEHAAAVSVLLDDDRAGAAAIRTLGKWGVTNAVPRLVAFLADPDERRRVAAANALRDLGDDRAVPALTAALADSSFIVRNCAQRALQSLGPEADEMLYAASDEAPPVVLRHLIRAMGRRGRPGMVGPLRVFLRRADWGVRGDAAQALLAIEPEHAPTWMAEAGLREDRLFVEP